MYSEIVKELIRVRLMCLLNHWGSYSYSEHKMWEEVGGDIYDMVDEIVESCQIPFGGVVEMYDIGTVSRGSGGEIIGVFGGIVDKIEALGEVGNSGVKSVFDNVVSKINQKVYLIKMQESGYGYGR